MKVYTVLDLMQNPLEELVLEQLNEAPSNGVQGQIYYNTVTNNIEYYNGSQWESINNFSSFIGIMNSQGFLNFVANGAFKWYSSGIPLNWTTGGSVLSNTTISQFAIGANVSGYLNRFTINGNTGTGTVYLQQGINVKGISDLILSLKTQTNNSNLEIFVNVIGYSGENFTGTTNTWNLTQNIPLNVITPITLDISGYFGNYESLEIQIGANVIGTGLSNATLDIGEISLYHSSGELNLPYQASLYDVFNILTDNNLILNNLTTTGDTTLGNATGDTVKTFNNTLDNGSGAATLESLNVTGNTTLDTLTTTGNTQLGNSSGNSVKTYNNTLDDGSGNLGIIGSFLSTGNLKLNRIAIFTANGNWTVPEGVTTIFVTGVAGGGGGGGGTTTVSGGNGGGAGYPVIKDPITVTPNHTLSITIGSGGANGGTTNTAGTAGGNTVLTDTTTSTQLLLLNGGGGGNAGGNGSSTVNASNNFGNLGYPYGGNGVILNGTSVGGTGGSSLFGGGGGSAYVFGSGSYQNGFGYGAGGGGGCGGNAGGNGTPGIIIIEW